MGDHLPYAGDGHGVGNNPGLSAHLQFVDPEVLFHPAVNFHVFGNPFFGDSEAKAAENSRAEYPSGVRMLLTETFCRSLKPRPDRVIICVKTVPDILTTESTLALNAAAKLPTFFIFGKRGRRVGILVIPKFFNAVRMRHF